MPHTTCRRSRSLRPLLPAVVLLTALGLVSLSATGVTQEGEGTAPPAYRELDAYRDLDSAAQLPLSAVDLFTSGVGYFQHDGVVHGNAEITLTVATGDINDLLKSLVLQDFDDGSVSAVTYPSQDPLARILDSFSLDLADNPALAELINRARGERVAVEGAASATGVVSGVEYRTRQTDTGTEREPVLNPLTGDGLRRLAFAEMRSIRFTDASLQAELDAALAVIAQNRHQDRKRVTIRFSGVGERRVRVAYVRAVPVWKTSYRVVLGEDGQAQIQGWAIVENTGEVDWTDVSLGLVSGRPVSFVMDLYSPIYTRRPRVEPDVGVAIAPQSYERDVPLAPSARSLSRAAEPMAEAEALFDDELAGSVSRRESQPIDLDAGVSSAARLESGAVYRIDHPVSIPRRGAALIPIVADRLPAERVAIFDRSVLADRPLSAVRLTNATGLQLPAGPATIFDGSTYAGDARLPELVDGEDRLVSYAVDLETTALVRSDAEPQEITRVTVGDGVLRVALRDRRETAYVFERIGSDDVELVLIHPRASGWEIAGDRQPVSETASAYRFETSVPAGASRTLTVTEERVRSQSISLQTIGDDQIGFYLSQRTIDDETARALERIRSLRVTVAERERERRGIEQEMDDVFRAQERIRSNLGVLESDTDLYRRYVETLTSQEETLEELQSDLRRARERESEARSALREFIESLQV
ncbi:MAG: hypothetical protein ACOC7V_03500 [Spirochaetota bacterium]